MCCIPRNRFHFFELLPCIAELNLKGHFTILCAFWFFVMDVGHQIELGREYLSKTPIE